jgi:hypothetical protein
VKLFTVLFSSLALSLVTCQSSLANQVQEQFSNLVVRTNLLPTKEVLPKVNVYSVFKASKSLNSNLPSFYSISNKDFGHAFIVIEVIDPNGERSYKSYSSWFALPTLRMNRKSDIKDFNFIRNGRLPTNYHFEKFELHDYQKSYALDIYKNGIPKEWSQKFENYNLWDNNCTTFVQFAISQLTLRYQNHKTVLPFYILNGTEKYQIQFDNPAKFKDFQ